jgi:adenylate cyclase
MRESVNRGEEEEAVRPAAEPLCFAGFVLDLEACTLARETGEAMVLTRGEFALLRAFVARPGRVLSRDALLSATANRPLEPFDRSIDMLVGRLRRKIEPDPKEPRLIVTVPGEGYRFDGKPIRAAARFDAESSNASGVQGGPDAVEPRPRPRRVAFLLAGLALVTLALTAIGLWPIVALRNASTIDPPRVAVLPFANLSGDPAMDYLGPGLAMEVTTLLASYPGVSAVAPPTMSQGAAIDVVRLAKDLKARFVLHGGVHRLPDRLRVTAQLYDGETGAAIWGDQIDVAGADPLRLQEEIAGRIYDSVAGFRGSIRHGEERGAWAKSSMALGEYDYYLRGLQVYMRFTLDDALKARAIWREGLDRYPDSALLKIKLAWTHHYAVMNEASADPRADIEQAWRYVQAASAKDTLSPLETWLAHELKAFLYQWRDNDFIRSVAEARAAVALVPNDPMSRNNLSWVLANAGLGEEAIAWARMGLEHHQNPPSWFRGNLAWAYYVSGRNQDALEILRDLPDDFMAMRVAAQIQLGQVDVARAAVADYLKRGGRDTVAQEALYPQVEPARTQFLEALRKAGFPET